MKYGTIGRGERKLLCIVPRKARGSHVFNSYTNNFNFVLYNQYHKKNHNHNLGPYLKYQKGFLLIKVVLMYMTKLSILHHYF